MPVVTERPDKHLPAREAGGSDRAAGRPAGGRGRWRLAPAAAGWLSMLSDMSRGETDMLARQAGS